MKLTYKFLAELPDGAAEWLGLGDIEVPQRDIPEWLVAKPYGDAPETDDLRRFLGPKGWHDFYRASEYVSRAAAELFPDRCVDKRIYIPTDNVVGQFAAFAAVGRFSCHPDTDAADVQRVYAEAHRLWEAEGGEAGDDRAWFGLPVPELLGRARGLVHQGWGQGWPVREAGALGEHELAGQYDVSLFGAIWVAGSTIGDPASWLKYLAWDDRSWRDGFYRELAGGRDDLTVFDTIALVRSRIDGGTGDVWENVRVLDDWNDRPERRKEQVLAVLAGT